MSRVSPTSWFQAEISIHIILIILWCVKAIVAELIFLKRDFMSLFYSSLCFCLLDSRLFVLFIYNLERRLFRRTVDAGVVQL